MTRSPTRRSVLSALGAGALCLAVGTAFAGGSPAGLAWRLRGGRVFARGRLEDRDVGIDPDGRIVLDDLTTATVAEVVDCTGRIVAPGFIDALADRAGGDSRVYEEYKLADGVTTALELHGGVADPGAYHFGETRRPHRINHGVGAKVMAVRALYASIDARSRQIERALDGGALSVSHSIEYQPVGFPELLTYARIAARRARPVVLHLRYSSAALELEGVREAVRLARESGAHVHIAHLNSTGGTFAPEAALDLLRAGLAEGLALTCCVYPYGFWATYLRSRRFDPGWRERYGLDYADLEVVGTGERLTARSFAHYRQSGSVIVAVPDGTMDIRRTVDLPLREPFCLVGSDGGMKRASGPNTHPRGSGTFATALRRAIDVGLGLEYMLGVLTERPRALIGRPLEDRGRITAGARADVVVFDPMAIRNLGTAAEPVKHSQGIDAVFVNGRLAYRAGLLEASGVGIRGA